MSDPNETAELWTKRLLCVLTALPPLLVGFLIVRYAVNVPHHDEWYWSVRHVLAGDLMRFDLAAFWGLENDDRVFLPKLIGTGLGHLTNLDMRYAIYLKLLLTIGSALVLNSLYRRKNTPAELNLVPVLLSITIFSLSQWPRWVDVRPIPSTLSILGLSGALWCICSGEPSRKRLLGALACAWISSSSYFSGNITWIVVFVAMALSKWNRRALLLWVVCASIVGAHYLYDFSQVSTQASQTQAPRVTQLVRFMVIFIGSVCSSGHRASPSQSESTMYGMLGLAAAFVLTLIAWFRLEDGRRRVAPWIAIFMWVAINGLAAGYGRIAKAGLAGARPWRYTVFGALFWAALAVLAALVLFDPSTRLQKRSRMTAFATIVLVLVGWAGGMFGMLQSGGLGGYPTAMRAGRATLLIAEGENDRDLEFIVPQIPTFRKQLPGLIERRASFLYGEHPLTLESSRRKRIVTFYGKSIHGEQQKIFRLQPDSAVAWRETILPQPFAHFEFGLAANQRLRTSRVTVRVRHKEDVTVVLDRVINSVISNYDENRIDLAQWIGKPVSISVRCEGESKTGALLVSPTLTYDVLKRSSQ